MLVNSINFGNYNAKALVNNPPYITNYPFYEYMRDNKLDFDSTDLKMSQSIEGAEKNAETKKDNIMTSLFVATASAVGLSIYVGRNKLRAGYRKLIGKFKN